MFLSFGYFTLCSLPMLTCNSSLPCLFGAYIIRKNRKPFLALTHACKDKQLNPNILDAFDYDLSWLPDFKTPFFSEIKQEIYRGNSELSLD